MFKDRTDAGRRLGQALQQYRGMDVEVLAIPKGGIEIGYHVASLLHAGLSIIISRKLPFPDNPESGFGAIVEDGSRYIIPGADAWVTKEEINSIIEEQNEEIQRRILVLRRGRPLPDIYGRSVILVDDGIAMGSTMRAAVRYCKNHKAGEIIIAAPVAGESVARSLGDIVDRIVILEKPQFFRAVAQVYENWYDVSDSEALSLLDRWDAEQNRCEREND